MRYGGLCRQATMGSGEYMDWGSHNAPKRVRYTIWKINIKLHL